MIPHFEPGPPVNQSRVYDNPAYAAYGAALAGAVHQRGPVVVVVICDRCGNRTIGTVSRRPAGLFYESRWEEPIPPGELAMRAEARATDPGSHMARRGRSVNGSRGLIDHPGFPAEWHAVAARCKDHGTVGIEIADLLRVTADARPDAPARVRVSPTPSR